MPRGRSLCSQTFAVNDRGDTMLKLTIALALLALLAAGERESYENYRVFRVTPTSDEQTSFLHYLSENSHEYNFWNGPSQTNVPADLMVAPDGIEDFENLMNAADLPYSTYIENVQRLIDTENPPLWKASSGFDWTSYHTLEEINAYLHKVAEDHPDKVEVVYAGKTYEKRDIVGVKVSFKQNNPGVFIEGGIHAREWISPATVTYLLNELLTSQNPEIRQMAESNDWYIFPVLNPDGFVYTHTKNRLWRKSRQPFRVCNGVDLNRNWGYKWMHGGASSNPCSETYAGTSAFSSVETATMSKYITSVSDKIYAFISFHSYSQLLLFPYGHTREHLDNYDEMYGVAKKTVEALAKRYGTQYRYGNIAETIYVATGSSVDWAKAVLNFPLSYTYELRDTGKYGFVLPARLIVPTAEETMDSLVAFFKESTARGIPQRL
ncbi:zinc carboxypeptidase-like [Venturia canescens]|uniref:zinc carboxypeptidase-like n=1 Tax=Venturia canescens TaxID=32260 RepID=UPI001C9C576A|nr:zinc carboxypeptidase-like [Venturia canescens]